MSYLHTTTIAGIWGVVNGNLLTMSNTVVVATDGDKIGQQVGRSAMADKTEDLRHISYNISRGNEIFHSWALAVGGEIISDGGDESRVQIPAEAIGDIPKLRDQYHGIVEATVSVGVGIKLSEAEKALVAAKLRGGNQIVFYDPSIEQEIKDLDVEEKDKITDAYGLVKADVAMNPGAFGGHHRGAGDAKPVPPKPEASEHSQGEALVGQIQDAQEGQPPQPELTHAADDAQGLEADFHDLAQKQNATEQQQSEVDESTKHRQEVKTQVIEILKKIKQQGPHLKQLQQTDPETYASVITMAQAMVALANELKEPESLEKAEDEGWDSLEEVFDLTELANGTERELEHTDNHLEAEKIAKDHLRENPHYYSQLEQCMPEKKSEQKEEISPEEGPAPKGELDKASLSIPRAKFPSGHEHLNLPVGTQIDGEEKIKVQHNDGTTSWVSVKAGQIMSQDPSGHPISSRNPGGK